MKDKFEQIPAKYRRWIVVGGVVSLISVVVVISGEMTSGGGGNQYDNPEDSRITNVLTDSDTSGQRFERLQAQIENLNDDREQLSDRIERLNNALERQESRDPAARTRRELEEVQAVLDDLRSQGVLEKDRSGRARLKIDESQYMPNIPGPDPTEGGDGESDQSDSGDETADETADEQIDRMARETDPMWAQPVRPGRRSSESGRDSDGEDGESSAQTGSTIRNINRSGESEGMAEDGTQQASSESGIQSSGSQTGEDEDQGNVYIPAGSIITGTLVTGMDAPTGEQARQDPHPALMRIKREAILPNRFRADVRECFALIGGRGSLSSERAYLRGETISCIRNDGGVVEASLNSYVVGEDGKAGLRGRLVSKQGQFLARALMSGFLQSFASAFEQTPVPSLNVQDGSGGEDGNNEQLYQQAFSNESLQSATVSGAGKAMDRLAEFYIDQAQGLFPIIEIDSGREIDMVMINGVDLEIVSNGGN